MPSGTINPKLKELRESRLVSRTAAGSYLVASHQLYDAIDDVKKGRHDL
jgi:hypothetical protein